MDPAYPRTGKRLPAILGSAKKPGRLAAHDGLGDRAWLVVDDVHELARRSRISGSKKLQARTVAYRFVCCNLRSTPRVVKRKMSNFGVKRDEHRNRPQPTRDPADTVTVARTGAPSRSTHQPRHDQANLKSLVLKLASIR